MRSGAGMATPVKTSVGSHRLVVTKLAAAERAASNIAAAGNTACPMTCEWSNPLRV